MQVRARLNIRHDQAKTSTGINRSRLVLLGGLLAGMLGQSTYVTQDGEFRSGFRFHFPMLDEAYR